MYEFVFVNAYIEAKNIILLESSILNIIINTKGTKICKKSKEKKQRIQDLKIHEVEEFNKVKKIKGNDIIKNCISIYLTEQASSKFNKPALVILFNIPSNENKSKELLFKDILEFNFDIKFEKVISQFRADFPIS